MKTLIVYYNIFIICTIEILLIVVWFLWNDDNDKYYHTSILLIQLKIKKIYIQQIGSLELIVNLIIN